MSERKKRLHQLLAVEGQQRGEADRRIAEGRKTFSQKEDHFNETTVHEHAIVEGLPEKPAEHSPMITTVDDKLEFIWDQVGRVFDIHLQKGSANQKAVANVILDNGTIVANDVPATVLLTLENDLLPKLRDLYDTIPTLRPGIKWAADEHDNNVFIAPVEVKYRTIKKVVPLIMYEATKEHPAQVREISEDIPSYRSETTRRSGVWTAKQKSDAKARIDELLSAVKQARQVANDVEHPDLHIGDKVMSYINTGRAV